MTRRTSRSGGVFLRLVLTVLVLVAAVAAGAFLSLNAAYQGFEKPVILEFPKGTSSPKIGAELAEAGIVRYNWQFLLVRALNPSRKLQAGEYQFTHADTPWHVFGRMVQGDVFFYELTVPEGSNIFDIAASIDQFDFLKGADFLTAARNPSLIRDLAPRAATLEGYLFPSTYRLTRSSTVDQVCHMMTDLFRKNWRGLQKGNHGVAVNDAVTLASLVEKETAVPEERPLVASVYRNRLEKGMALDCDPTTIYAALLDRRYRGTIHQSDLHSSNAYNTYQHAGLPPGPIANPGVASLRAALAPAETDYLYFVAKPDGSGGHHFSKSIAEHNRAVEEYRRGLKKQASIQAPPHSHPSSTHRRGS